MARIVERDPLALDALYRRHQPMLRQFVARRIDTPDMVDDLVHETMLVVWHKAASFRGEARLSTWLCGIAYRLSLRALRKEQPLRQAVDIDDVQLVGDGTPEESFSEGERTRVVKQALAKLSAEHRAVIELTYFNGLGYREIAERLNCPVGTVKTRMMHARTKMRHVLGSVFQEAQDR